MGLIVINFFYSISYIVQDGFDRQYQASVEFPLTNAGDKSQQHPNKFSGMPRIKPGAVG